MSNVRVEEKDGQLHVNVTTVVGDNVSWPFHLVVEFGDDLDRLIDVLRAYQYDHEQQQDAY